jgi:hypothetical protein
MNERFYLRKDYFVQIDTLANSLGLKFRFALTILAPMAMSVPKNCELNWIGHEIATKNGLKSMLSNMNWV